MNTLTPINPDTITYNSSNYDAIPGVFPSSSYLSTATQDTASGCLNKCNEEKHCNSYYTYINNGNPGCILNISPNLPLYTDYTTNSITSSSLNVKQPSAKALCSSNDYESLGTSYTLNSKFVESEDISSTIITEWIDQNDIITTAEGNPNIKTPYVELFVGDKTATREEYETPINCTYPGQLGCGLQTGKGSIPYALDVIKKKGQQTLQNTKQLGQNSNILQTDIYN